MLIVVLFGIFFQFNDHSILSNGKGVFFKLSFTVSVPVSLGACIGRCVTVTVSAMASSLPVPMFCRYWKRESGGRNDFPNFVGSNGKGNAARLLSVPVHRKETTTRSSFEACSIVTTFGAFNAFCLDSQFGCTCFLFLYCFPLSQSPTPMNWLHSSKESVCTTAGRFQSSRECWS